MWFGFFGRTLVGERGVGGGEDDGERVRESIED